jgi:hypothetical protein
MILNLLSEGAWTAGPFYVLLLGRAVPLDSGYMWRDEIC